jgi:N6-adenosine-specific RNA methylase IME4
MRLMQHIVTNCCALISIIQSILCAVHVLFVFTSECLSVYSFHLVESLIIKHTISVATTLNTGTKHMLLSTQEEVEIMNTMDATESNIYRYCHFQVMYKE